MADVGMIALIVGLVVALAGYVGLCDRVVSDGDASSRGAHAPIDSHGASDARRPRSAT